MIQMCQKCIKNQASGSFTQVSAKFILVLRGFPVRFSRYPLYCSGAHGAHKSPLHVYSWEHGERGTQVSVTLAFRKKKCQWLGWVVNHYEPGDSK